MSDKPKKWTWEELKKQQTDQNIKVSVYTEAVFKTNDKYIEWLEDELKAREGQVHWMGIEVDKLESLLKEAVKMIEFYGQKNLLEMYKPESETKDDEYIGALYLQIGKRARIFLQENKDTLERLR